jgi:DNA polymerase III delta prime subunit
MNNTFLSESIFNSLKHYINTTGSTKNLFLSNPDVLSTCLMNSHFSGNKECAKHIHYALEHPEINEVDKLCQDTLKFSLIEKLKSKLAQIEK